MESVSADTVSTGRLERRILAVCDAAGGFIEYWGFKSIHGRIWTLLALSKSPLTQMQVVDTLSVSRSLISTAMGELVQFGLVQPVSEHRNSPYVAVLDVWPTVSEILREREWMILETARNAIEAALEEVELAEQQGMDTDYSSDRLRLLLNMTDSAQAMAKMLISLRIPTSLEGVGQWVGRARSLLQSFRGGS